MATHYPHFADFDGDGRSDVLVFRPDDGYFAKWYSDAARGPDFAYTEARYIGGSPGALPGAQLIVADFDGDGRSDVLVFRPDDGYFAKWYSDAARGPDFAHTEARYIGGSPGALPGAQLIVGDFDGDGRADVLVFRPSDGYFAKWYSDAGRGPDFAYTEARYIGGSPGALPGAQLIVGDFDGDGRSDVLVFRPDDGYFAKWYSDAGRGPDFAYTEARYIGGSPGALPGAQLIVGDFDGDGRADVLVFRPSDGYFAKWYSDAARGPDFAYTEARYLAGQPEPLVPGLHVLAADFDADGRSDVLFVATSDGYYRKGYSDVARSPDFEFTTPVQGTPGAQLLTGDFDGDQRTDVLAFRSGDGYCEKWYSEPGRRPDFTSMEPRYIGGAPNALSGAQLVTGAITGILPPSVTTLPANPVTYNGATLNGKVNPEGTPSRCHFEFGPTIAYGHKGPQVEIDVGSASVSISASATLSFPSETTWHFRLVATNSGGTAYGQDLTFTTARAPAPAVTTREASQVTTDTATLQGEVRPYGAAAHYHFEYGTTTSYGSRVPTSDGEIGDGTDAINVSAAVGSLKPATVYHFRLVATTVGGTVYGADVAFVTTSTTPKKGTYLLGLNQEASTVPIYSADPITDIAIPDNATITNVTNRFSSDYSLSHRGSLYVIVASGKSVSQFNGSSIKQGAWSAQVGGKPPWPSSLSASIEWSA